MKYLFNVDKATDSKILNDYKIIVHELELSKLPTLKKKNKVGGFCIHLRRKIMTM